MDKIGKDCWNIINDYKYQFEHVEKFEHCLREIKTYSTNIMDWIHW